jgi:RNA polymerase sigma-70 factor (ECF subfamily)
MRVFAEVVMSFRETDPTDPGPEELAHMHAAAAGVLRRLIGAEDPDYEDLVQSTLAQVLTSFDRNRFRGDCPPGGWAAVIARNVAIDTIRARSRERALFTRDGSAEVTVAEVSPLDPRRGPEHITSVQERLAKVRAALSTVGARKAEVVVMHDLLGHDLTAVARKLRISVSAAQSRLVRGRREIVDRSQLTPPPRIPRPRRSRGEAS